MASLVVRFKSVNPSDKDTLPNELILSLKDTVEKVKELVSEKNGVPIDEMKLIYKGKVLVNEKTLEFYSVVSNDMFVYLRSKSSKPKPAPPADSPKEPLDQTINASATSGSTPITGSVTNLNANASIPNPPSGTPATNVPRQTPILGAATSPLNTLRAFGSGSMNLGNAADMEEMSRQMMNNPEMMRNFMNNPLIQNMMSNPDMLRSMFMNNPQIQQMLRDHPELSHVLNDPELMRRQMEMMRNPEQMQEMLRQQDLMLSNIENLPGGYDALRQHYEQVQRPMMDALSGRNNQNERSSNEEDEEEKTADSDQPADNPFGANQQARVPRDQANVNPGSGAASAGFPFLTPTNGSVPNLNQMMNSLNAMGLGGMQAGQQGQLGMPDMSQFMTNMSRFNEMFGMGTGMTPNAAPIDPNLPPEQRYSSQLQQLEQMGFTNQRDNIAALSATNGNVDRAIDRLLGMGL